MTKVTYFVCLLFVLPSMAMGEECSLVVNSNDGMRFDTNRIVVPSSCKKFTVHLYHLGKRPAKIMGHNWVLSKKSDAFNIYRQGRGYPDNGFTPPGDARVIAQSEMIGGGEKASVSFLVAELSKNEKYAFFCSFPGHMNSMLGSLVVE